VLSLGHNYILAYVVKMVETTSEMLWEDSMGPGSRGIILIVAKFEFELNLNVKFPDPAGKGRQPPNSLTNGGSIVQVPNIVYYSVWW